MKKPKEATQAQARSPLQTGPVVRLQLHMVDEAASLAAAAFVHAASYSYIYEGLTEDQRLEALTWLFRTNIRLRVVQKEKHGAWCAFDTTGKRMLCFFMLQPPGLGDIGTLTMVRNGILLFPFRFGFRAFRRLLEVKDFHENVEKKAQIDFQTELGQLERMVVHPDAQCGGIGSRCLDEALAASGFSVLLETQSPLNVKFYTRLGFEVLGERDESYFKTASSSGETSWTMVKRAVSKD
jgi:ribosomal protein S18 acetylase RimI-like enzyme